MRRLDGTSSTSGASSSETGEAQRGGERLLERPLRRLRWRATERRRAGGAPAAARPPPSRPRRARSPYRSCLVGSSKTTLAGVDFDERRVTLALRVASAHPHARGDGARIDAVGHRDAQSIAVRSLGDAHDRDGAAVGGGRHRPRRLRDEARCVGPSDEAGSVTGSANAITRPSPARPVRSTRLAGLAHEQRRGRRRRLGRVAASRPTGRRRRRARGAPHGRAS